MRASLKLLANHAKIIARRKVQIPVYKTVASWGIPVLSPLLSMDLSLLQQGLLTTATLVQMAEKSGFGIKNVLGTKIHPSTVIEAGAIIGDSVEILGKEVVIRAGAKLTRSKITGNKVVIGQETSFDRVKISASNISLGTENTLHDVEINQDNITIGKNNLFNGTRIHSQENNNRNANLTIGNHNVFGRTNIHNETGGEIVIRDHNTFGDNAQVRLMVSGWIFIGNYNSIGMDGGGVLSTAYRFNKNWCGPVYVGYGLATKRGAEVLGLGAYGATPEMVETALNNMEIEKREHQTRIENMFLQGTPQDIVKFLETLKTISIPAEKPADNTVMFVGVVKPKATLAVGIPTPEGKTIVRDGSRIQHSVLAPATNMHEGVKFYFSSSNSGQAISARSSLVGEVECANRNGYPNHWSDKDFR